MKKYIDSEIVILNNDKYLVYLKQVPVRKGKNGEINTIIRAFVKKVERGKKARQNQIELMPHVFLFHPLLVAIK